MKIDQPDTAQVSDEMDPRAAAECPLFARTCSPEADVSRMILAIFDQSGSAGKELHLCLLRQLQGVLHLDAKISDGDLELGMAQ